MVNIKDMETLLEKKIYSLHLLDTSEDIVSSIVVII